MIFSPIVPFTRAFVLVLFFSRGRLCDGDETLHISGRQQR